MEKVERVKKLSIKILIYHLEALEMLKLNNPIYEVTSAYGHFEENLKKGEFSWEKR